LTVGRQRGSLPIVDNRQTRRDLHYWDMVAALFMVVMSFVADVAYTVIGPLGAAEPPMSPFR
jgi:hypothetical protein